MSKLVEIAKGLDKEMNTFNEPYTCRTFCLNCSQGMKDFTGDSDECRKNGHVMFHNCFEGGDLGELKDIILYIMESLSNG